MKKIKCLISILLMIFIIMISGYVSAFSASMKLESSSKLNMGDTVEVTLKISNIDAGAGIDAIVATLEYDKNVFDLVTKDSFIGLNGWNLGIYSETTQMLTLLNSSKVNTSSDVLKLKLKVKSVTNVQSSNIKFKDITASGGALVDGGTGEIEISDVNVTLNKSTSTQTNNNTTINNNQTSNNKNTVKNNIIINSNNNNNNNKLPKTGDNFTIIFSILLISLLVVSIIAYIKYRKLNIK